MLGYLTAEVICFEKENCEVWGTDTVQGQTSKHMFAPNVVFCVYYPSNIFRNTYWKLGHILGYSPVLASDIRSRVDQSRESETIWWIIIEILKAVNIDNNSNNDNDVFFKPRS